MGTGGTPSPLSPETEIRCPYLQNLILAFFTKRFSSRSPVISRSASLPLRFALHSPVLDQALDRLVLTSFRIAALTPSTYQPCRLQGVLPACAVGYFFLRGASRLDAFSVYPVRISLPCCAVGTTTVAPVMRPSRSSRTRDSSSQISCAHDR